MIASVGDSTLSITIAKGSRTPVASSASRSAISAVELGEQIGRGRARRAASTGCVLGQQAGVGHRLSLQRLDGVDQLADGLDLGLHVHRDDDVELVLDRRDEIHHGQAVPFEIAGRSVVVVG